MPNRGNGDTCFMQTCALDVILETRTTPMMPCPIWETLATAQRAGALDGTMTGAIARMLGRRPRIYRWREDTTQYEGEKQPARQSLPGGHGCQPRQLRTEEVMLLADTAIMAGWRTAHIEDCGLRWHATHWQPYTDNSRS